MANVPFFSMATAVTITGSHAARLNVTLHDSVCCEQTDKVCFTEAWCASRGIIPWGRLPALDVMHAECANTGALGYI